MKKQKEQKTEQSGNGKGTTIYINPRTDFGFKRLFMEGLKAKVRLLDLLKTFFPEPLGGASHLVVKPTELLGDIENEKRGRPRHPHRLNALHHRQDTPRVCRSRRLLPYGAAEKDGREKYF